MARRAISRGVSDSLPRCELTFLRREPIDVGLARQQHAAYVRALEKHGCKVAVLPALHDMPDAVFVEDPIVVLDECAVVVTLGTAKRRAEIPSLATEVEKHRPLRRTELPGLLDGGDVLRIGRTLFVGRSTRTNDEGIEQLGQIASPLGYEVRAVELGDCLHLKSRCTFAGEHVLIHEPWVDPRPFEGYPLLRVPASEPGGANVLRLATVVLVSASHPKTEQLLRGQGYETVVVDISEMEKAEAALTCMSVLV